MVEDVVDDHHPAKFLLPSMRAASSTASTHITPRMPQASNINPPTPIQQTHHGKNKLFIDFKFKVEPKVYLLLRKRLTIRVVGFDQLFRNPPSKPSNVQVDEGLFQAKLILKAITTSSLIPKSKNCHWGKYKMKYLTSPNMTISFY